MELMKKFPAYKTNSLNFCFDVEELKSIDAYAHCFTQMNGDPPSRSSVINFLNLLEDSKYLESRTETGKGGHHKIYSMAMPKEEALLKMSSDLNNEFTNKILKGLN